MGVDFDKIAANKLNNFFARVGEELASMLPAAGCVVDDTAHAAQTEFTLVPVTEEELAVCVNELRGGSAPGVDNIFADVIKDNFSIIAAPLLKIINISLTTGVFPTAFKTAKVIPLFKGGKKDECSNYRPISLLSVIFKSVRKMCAEAIK